MSNLISRFISILVRPIGVLRSIKEEGENVGIVPSLIFVIVLSVVAGIISVLMGFIFKPEPVQSGEISQTVYMLLTLLGGPIMVILGSFISSFFAWGITDGFFRGSLPQFKTTYRVLALPAAFYPLSALLGPIPTVGQYLGIAIQVWIIVYVIWGLIVVKGAKLLQTVIISVLFFGFLLLMAVAASTVSRQFGGGDPFGGLQSDLGDFDYGADEAELDALLEQRAAEAAEETAK